MSEVIPKPMNQGRSQYGLEIIHPHQQNEGANHLCDYHAMICPDFQLFQFSNYFFFCQ